MILTFFCSRCHWALECHRSSIWFTGPSRLRSCSAFLPRISITAFPFLDQVHSLPIMTLCGLISSADLKCFILIPRFSRLGVTKLEIVRVFKAASVTITPVPNNFNSSHTNRSWKMQFVQAIPPQVCNWLPHSTRTGP